MWTLSRDVLENLLQHGFDIDLIAFEFGVPKEKLELYKSEFEKNNLLVRKNRKLNEQGRLSIGTPEDIRMKYYTLIRSNTYNIENNIPSTNSGIPNIKKALPTQEELEKNNEILEKIKVLLIDGDKKKPDEKRNIAKSIYAEYKNIDLDKLTLEQIVILYQLFENNLLHTYPLYSTNDGLFRAYEYTRRKIIKIICDELSERLKSTNSLEELEELNKIASLLTARENRLAVDTIKGNISEKIRRIKSKRLTDEINNVSLKVIEIVNKIFNRNVDIEEIRSCIDLEALRVCQEKRNNGYLQYTITSAKNRIYQQIHAIIRENGDQYQIEDIEELVTRLSEITEKDEETCVKTVIANLTQRKEYQRAQFVCEMYRGDDKKSDIYKRFQTVKQSVQRMELGNAVLSLIHGGTPEEEQKWIRKINKMKANGIKTELVLLGKTPNGKVITLSELLDDEINF